MLIVFVCSVSAASAQDNSLPPCSRLQLENAEPLLAEFDGLAIQAASVETSGDLLEFGTAQLAWREATWSRLTYCAELFELALLNNQVTETVISGRVLGYAGVEQDDNPFVEPGFASARRLTSLEAEVEKARQLVTTEMLRIGTAGTTDVLNRRLEHLAALGVRHLSFGPPLGPEILAAIEAIGRDVIRGFRDR